MLTGFAAFPVITYIRKFCRKKNPSMLKSYVKTCEAVKRLGTDQDGVASFEYVVVAA